MPKYNLAQVVINAREQDLSVDQFLLYLDDQGYTIVLKEHILLARRQAVEAVADAFALGTSNTHKPIHPQTVADRIRAIAGMIQ